ELNRSMHTRLSIFDLKGREVALVQDGPQHAGKNSQYFLNTLAPGTYIVRLSGEGHYSTQKIVVV
ncbi:MAG: T9SS type A sorting domain-containing protein, partial [Pontibacter sp.]|nr:T9SS type A sorting domain-containing protein [Pontibacter sp.]